MKKFKVGIIVLFLAISGFAYAVSACTTESTKSQDLACCSKDCGKDCNKNSCKCKDSCKCNDSNSCQKK